MGPAAPTAQQRREPPEELPRDEDVAPRPRVEWALEAKDLHKTYQLSKTNVYEALRGVDLRVRPGELVSIMGPSGSGKSTLLNVLGTLDRPTQGTVRVEGVDTADMGDNELADLRSRRIGFVFQNFSLVPRMRAVDNVALPLVPRGLDPEERTRRAEVALERVGMADKAGNRPGELSGGQQQRVALARALVNEPAVVLADEPTGNLDTRTGEQVVELLLETNAAGVTLLIVTHDTDIAHRAPRLVRLRDGLVVGDGPPEEA